MMGWRWKRKRSGLWLPGIDQADTGKFHPKLGGRLNRLRRSICRGWSAPAIRSWYCCRGSFGQRRIVAALSGFLLLLLEVCIFLTVCT
jgi:hypothetical protein